jgi:hypothetical protein
MKMDPPVLALNLRQSIDPGKVRDGPVAHVDAWIQSGQEQQSVSL